jgi:hypothetical protein
MELRIVGNNYTQEVDTLWQEIAKLQGELNQQTSLLTNALAENLVLKKRMQDLTSLSTEEIKILVDKESKLLQEQTSFANFMRMLKGCEC